MMTFKISQNIVVGAGALILRGHRPSSSDFEGGKIGLAPSVLLTLFISIQAHC